MTTISIAICAHVSRKEQAEDLAARLGCPISMDEGDLGSIVNHDAAMRLAAQTPADWTITMEDDASPIPDFHAQAAAALATAPIPFASLYYGYVGHPEESITTMLAENDPNWYVIQGWANTVCVAVRSDHVATLLNTSEKITEELPADHRWGEAARRLGYGWIPHSYPSLVEHLDKGSLIAGPQPPGFRRRAYVVGGRELWTGTTL